ncbi:MAG: hypothetical protein V8T10_00440 [Merdibacter sp.]
MQYFHEERIQVMELPPYRLPSLGAMGKTALHHKMIAYLREAGRGADRNDGPVVSFLSSLRGAGRTAISPLRQRAAAPVFEPLGFGDSWVCVASLGRHCCQGEHGELFSRIRKRSRQGRSIFNRMSPA